MIPYLVIFLCVIGCSLLDFRTIPVSRRERETVVALLCLTLALFVGMRDMIGGYDVYIYGEIFDITPPITSFPSFLGAVFGRNVTLPQVLEPGYVAIGGILKLFTDSRYHFFLVMSLLCYCMVFRIFNRYMPFVFLAIFIFSCKFMLMSFVYVRQFLAMAIVWSALPYVLRRDPVRFGTLLLIAFLIHNSSLLFLPVYFLGNRRFPAHLILSVMAVTFILGTTPFFSAILGEVGEKMNIQKAQLYANRGIGGINYFYVLEATIIGSFLYFTRRLFYTGRESTLFYNLALAYVCATFFTLRDATGVRFTWYFLIGMVYVISSLPYCFRFAPYARRYICLGMFLYFSALHFRLLMIWDGGDMMPYQTYVTETARPTRWSQREYSFKYVKPKKVEQL